jgi:formate dehydrogenase maturation protein FdhE
MLLLTLRADVDKIDILQRQYYELEIAGYKSHIAKLEEAARERMKMAMCHICYKTPNSHFLSCGHAFCQECIFRWVIVRKTCPTCRKPCTLPLKAYDSIIIDS